MQFARAVGLEVTLASYALLEELILRARGLGGLDVREQRGHHPFPSLNGSTIADSVSSHSKYLLPTVSGFTAKATSVETVQPGGSEGSVVGNVTQGRQPMELSLLSRERKMEEVPLAALSRKLKTKVSKKVDSLRFSRECCPNSIIPNNQDEDGGYSQRKRCNGCAGRRFLLSEQRIFQKIY